MSEQMLLPDEFWLLLDAAGDGTLDETQTRELAALLDANLSARNVFVDQIQLWTDIHVLVRAERASDTGLAQVRATLQASPSLSPVQGFLSATIPNTVAYFSEGWPVAYLIATVIFGIGLMVGALVHVSDPVQTAQRTTPLPSHLSPLPSTVGRITGMVDCKWAEDAKSEIRNPKPEGNHKSEIRNQKSLVALGDKFALASGLMEITYDTGAKVILQAPVTYEVESAAGGFLSMGKLTARLEKKVASGQWPVAREGKTNATNSDALATGHWPLATSSNPQSPIPNPSSLSTIHYPLFTIKTPTAIVTDLGTEFGVEVHESGLTTAYVFRGVVQVQPGDVDGKLGGKAVRLTENESVQVEKQGSGGAVKVSARKVDPATFARFAQLPRLAEEQRLKPLGRWQVYSQQVRRDPSLLAYYDFQLKTGDPAVLSNVAANGEKSLDGVVENAAWVNGRLPGKHALLFNGPTDCVRVNLPQKTDDLTLAAWICVDSLDHSNTSGLLMSTGLGKPGQIHWQMDNKNGHVGLVRWPTGDCDGPPVMDSGRLRQWVHLACVSDHAAGRVSFYVNGQCMGEGESRSTFPIIIGPACIGNWDSDGHANMARNFRGLMDELAVVGRALSTDEIKCMYEAGKP